MSRKVEIRTACDGCGTVHVGLCDEPVCPDLVFSGPTGWVRLSGNERIVYACSIDCASKAVLKLLPAVAQTSVCERVGIETEASGSVTIPAHAPLKAASRAVEAAAAVPVPTPAPWGPQHQQEAHRRLYELGALSVAAGLLRCSAATFSAGIRHGDYETEKRFRACLVRADLPAEGSINADGVYTSGADADREVQRVRDFAEGRKVRETLWCTANKDGGRLWVSTRTEARCARLSPRSIVCRVNRTKRAA